MVMTSTPKYLEKFELLYINLKDFRAKSAIFHLYFLLSSYQCQNSKCLLLVRRHAKQYRQKKKRSQETDVIQPVDATHSNSQEQIPEKSSSTDLPQVAPPLIVGLPCQDPKKCIKKRISRQVAKCNREIDRLKRESRNKERTYKAVSK